MANFTPTTLVTGAAGHLGTAISKHLALKAKHHVLLNGRTEETLQKLHDEIVAEGGKCDVLCFDITKEQEIIDNAKKVTETYGKLDCIVSNASIGRAGSVDDAKWEDFEETLCINMLSPFFLVQKFLPLLEASKLEGGASVVNISSMYGMVSPDPSVYGDSGMNNPPFYGAGKAAVIQLTRYLACHLGGRNIRVNAVSPGPFPPEKMRETLDWFLENLEKKNPLGRIGQPHEVGGVIAFLLSPEASYITGTNVPVDGGWTAW